VKKKHAALIAALMILVAACQPGVEEEVIDEAPEAAEDPAVAETDEEPVTEEDEEVEEEPSGFFAGETIELIVPLGEGGGTDAQARFVAAVLSEVLEGNPSVQVVNLPGAAGTVGTMEFIERRPSDGLHVLMTSGSIHMNYVLGDPSVEFDLAELTPVAGFPVGGVMFVSPDTGVESLADLGNPPGDPLRYLGVDPTASDLSALLAFEALDIEVQMIMGYDGFGPARVAFEQGEGNFALATHSGAVAWQPMVEDGLAEEIFSFGEVVDGNIGPDPGFPPQPTVRDAYIELHGEEPSGDMWEAYVGSVQVIWDLNKAIWFHGDAPQEAIDEFTAGLVTLLDEGYYDTEEGMELFGGINPVHGDQLDAGVEQMFGLDEAVVQTMRDYLVEVHDVERLAD
jgi:hypothetical protein